MVRVMGSDDDIYRDRGPSVVRLHRRNSVMVPTGVFRCEIPDVSGASQNIYVGIYPESDVAGIPSITSVMQVGNTTTLICTSTGGPPTTVTWMKDGQELTIDGITYQQPEGGEH